MRAVQVFAYPTGFALILPYYALGDLDFVTAKHPFNSARKKEAIRQILDGLCALHDLLRIHRDIKPANILVQSLQPLNLVISDFGQVSLSDATTFVGTSKFRAPEILLCGLVDSPYTTAVDIYSVGMIILWLLGDNIISAGPNTAFLLTEMKFIELVGSKIATALSRHPPGEIHDALAMAEMMAQWDPDKRPSAAACLQFPWVNSQATVNAVSINTPHTNALLRQDAQPIIRRSSRLRKQAGNSHQQRWDPMEIDDL